MRDGDCCTSICFTYLYRISSWYSVHFIVFPFVRTRCALRTKWVARVCARDRCMPLTSPHPKTKHIRTEKREINYTRSRVSIELNALMVPCNDKVVRQIERAGNAGAQQPRHRHLSRIVVCWWQWLLQMQSSTNLVGRTTRQDDHKHRWQLAEHETHRIYIFISPFYNFLLKLSVLAPRKWGTFYSFAAKCR